MTHVVIFHGGCFDGVAAAWVVKKHLNNIHVDDKLIKFHAAHYGQPFPSEVKDRTVYIVDFSYKREVMKELAAQALSVTVIDHHKTAEADLLKLDEECPNVITYFDMERSGAGLAWDTLNPGVPRPEAIDFVEDRDLWRFRYGSTKPFIAALATGPLDILSFEYAKGRVGEYVTIGNYVLNYIEAFGHKACEHWTLKSIGGFAVPTINVPYMNSSDHVATLMKLLPGHSFYAYFFMRAGGKWQFGLRSQGDFDVSKIAQMYGGGGHKNAAGFEVDILPWEAQAE